MCGSDGGKALGDLSLDVASQFLTGGAVSYKDGKFGTGLSQKVLSQTEQGTDLSFETLPGTKLLKDVTGATAAEEATAESRLRFEEEKADALKAREDAKAQTAAERLSASRKGASIRGGTSSTSTSTSRSSSLGQDERDFLGL